MKILKRDILLCNPMNSLALAHYVIISLVGDNRKWHTVDGTMGRTNKHGVTVVLSWLIAYISMFLNDSVDLQSTVNTLIK